MSARKAVAVEAACAARLPATLHNAVRAPFYRQAFGEHWQGVRTLDDLARLPLLDKLTAIKHQRQLIVGMAPAGFGVASSGTTRTDVDLPPLNVVTSPEELLHACAPDPDGDDDPFPGWTLVSIAITHGLPAGPPRRGELFLPWMYDRNALYMLESVLQTPQPDGRRVTALRISVGALKVLTAWLLERERNPADLGVRLIGTNSFRLSPFWRDLVEVTWNATIYDNYSLSEFATPATECKACGWLHFGAPPVLYEILDLVSGRRRSSGAGRLVLTGLFPFVQKMPLIRYDTGDVVELGPRCRVSGARGVRFLGRIRRGLVIDDDGQGTYVLSPCVVQDVLEALPSSERSAHPFTTLGLLRSRDIGLPRWHVTQDDVDDTGKSIARLRFEVRFDPHIFRAHARELGCAVRDDVLSHDKALRSLVRRGRLRFIVDPVSAQTLTPPPDKHD